MTTTFDRIRSLIIEYWSGVAVSMVTPATHLFDDLEFDNQDRMDLLSFCEDDFGIDIPDSEFESVSTVADVVKLVDRLAGKA